MSGAVSAKIADCERPAEWGELVDTAPIPGGGALELVRHGRDYEILLGDELLMGSATHYSETALATLVLAPFARPCARVLIGGLGMGFTLAAARSVLLPDAIIHVAELVPQVAAWAQGPLAHLFAASLADPRVSVEIADVHDAIVNSPGGYDAILLDVDNGPDGLVSAGNERLYCNWGLRAARTALRPGGVLAVWSAYADPAFVDRLSAAGFSVAEHAVSSGGRKDDPPHLIWLAARIE